MKFKSKYCSRDRSALNEITDRPIFLFQQKIWQLIGVPDGYELGDECQVYPIVENPDEDYEPESLTWEELSQLQHGDYDVPCAIFHWETRYVFLTRQEAEEFGEAKHYNYRDGWRVYAVCAKGELREALVDGTEMTLND